MKYEMKIKRDDGTNIILYTTGAFFDDDKTNCNVFLKVKRISDNYYEHIKTRRSCIDLTYEEMMKVNHKVYLEWVTEEEIAKAKQKFVKMYNRELNKKQI